MTAALARGSRLLDLRHASMPCLECTRAAITPRWLPSPRAGPLHEVSCTISAPQRVVASWRRGADRMLFQRSAGTRTSGLSWRPLHLAPNVLKGYEDRIAANPDTPLFLAFCRGKQFDEFCARHRANTICCDFARPIFESRHRMPLFLARRWGAVADPMGCPALGISRLGMADARVAVAKVRRNMALFLILPRRPVTVTKSRARLDFVTSAYSTTVSSSTKSSGGWPQCGHTRAESHCSTGVTSHEWTLATNNRADRRYFRAGECAGAHFRAKPPRRVSCPGSIDTGRAHHASDENPVAVPPRGSSGPPGRPR